MWDELLGRGLEGVDVILYSGTLTVALGLMLEDAELALVPSVDQQVELALAVAEPDVVWPALVDVLEHRDA